MTLSNAILRRTLWRPFRYYASVNSTNNLAKEWLLAGAPELAAVIADAQRRGRGRKGRAWQTPPKSALAVSVILRPPAAALPLVNMLGALSVYDLAQAIGCPDICLKWPNDVQAGDKKICGILPEPVWQGPRLLGVVLGIGINVRIDFKGSALQESAISLETLVKRRLERAELLAILLRRLEQWYKQIDSDAPYQAWRIRLVTLNQRVVVDDLAGTALDAAADGSLLLLDEAGQRHRIIAGDVFLPESVEKAK